MTTAPGQVLPPGVKLEVMTSSSPLVVASQQQHHQAAAAPAGVSVASAGTPVLMQSQAVKVELVKPPFSVPPQLQVGTHSLVFIYGMWIFLRLGNMGNQSSLHGQEYKYLDSNMSKI